jgi:hypothetical protein
MKKATTLLTLFALLSTTSLSAQAGDGAATAAKTAKNNSWQNWVFAGGALIAAAVGITVVMINQGSSNNSQ